MKPIFVLSAIFCLFSANVSLASNYCYLAVDLYHNRLYIGGTQIKEYSKERTDVVLALDQLSELIRSGSCKFLERKICDLTLDLDTVRVYYGGGELFATKDYFEAKNVFESLKAVGNCHTID